MLSRPPCLTTQTLARACRLANPGSNPRMITHNFAAIRILAAGALLLFNSPARPDFSVNYNGAGKRISVIDNETGAVVISSSPGIRQSVLTPRSGAAGDNTIEPSVSWTPHGNPAHA